MRFLRTRRAVTVAVATFLTVPFLGAVTAGAASAHPSTSATAKGRVIAPLAVRTLYTTVAKRVGTLHKGKVVTIYCKHNGVPVDGNPRWYKLGNNRWVSARYVTNIGPAPKWCGGSTQKAKVVGKPGVTIRTAPTTRSRAVGHLAYGKVVPIICKVNGQTVGGNPRWYQLYSGRWISARYAKNLSTIPKFCR
ncbi:MAG TPA: SH3 domain-containing protein [Actinopolymorphaceae bacterium]